LHIEDSSLGMKVNNFRCAFANLTFFVARSHHAHCLDVMVVVSFTILYLKLLPIFAFHTFIVTLFPLKVLVPCEKCSWFKIVIMIFWKGWRSPTPLKPKIHCFLVGRTASYSFYFLLNLQLK
jgi:hypothetical protein